MTRDTRKNKESRVYFAVSLALMLIVNRVIFPLAHFLAQGAPHRDLSLPLDARVPFLPWMVVVYVGVFAWWLYICWLMSNRDREEADRFFLSMLLMYGISFLFFVFLPTSIVRPELTGDSIWIVFLKLVYRFDTPDNLFPSIHCSLGWLHWAAIRGKKDIPFAIRCTGFLLAAAVCFSTVAIRQHVLADVFGGILLGEICWFLARFPTLRGWYAARIDRLMKPFLRRGQES